MAMGIWKVTNRSLTAQWDHSQELKVSPLTGSAIKILESLGMEGFLKTQNVLTTKKIYLFGHNSSKNLEKDTVKT